MDIFSLAEKTAVVTGPGNGIVRNIAELLARQGAFVHILDLDSEAGEDVVTEIERKEGKRDFIK